MVVVLIEYTRSQILREIYVELVLNNKCSSILFGMQRYVFMVWLLDRVFVVKLAGGEHI